MRFGLGFIPRMPAAEVVGLVRLAEELGYDCALIPDQTFFRDPFVLLGLCAQATQRIQLGVAVTNPYTRHPVQIARAAASLAEASGGRFVLALGAGNRIRLLSALGLDSGRAAQRVAECVLVCRRLFQGERVTHESESLHLRDVELEFPARGDIPIYIGSQSPRLLETAGRLADGVLMQGLFTPGGLDYAWECISAGAAAAGRDPARLRRVAWQSVFLTDGGMSGEAELAFRNWAGRIVARTQDAVLERIGIPAAVAAQVREDLAAHGEVGLGRRLAPEHAGRVVMAGDAAQVAAQVALLAQRGVDLMAVLALGGTDEVRGLAERFAAGVMPLFGERD